MSTAKFYGILGVVGAVAARSVQRLAAAADPWADVRAFSPTPRFWSALPILVFGFQCHTNVSALTGQQHGAHWVRCPGVKCQAARHPHSAGGSTVQAEKLRILRFSHRLALHPCRPPAGHHCLS